jgi:pilin isopeptide linkage protein
MASEAVSETVSETQTATSENETKAAATEAQTEKGKKAKAAAKASRSTDESDQTYDLTDYLTDGSYINIVIDGKEYTLDELNASGMEIPAGANVYVKLVFEDLKDIPEGTTLTYQIPKALVVAAATTPTKLTDANTYETLGSFVIDEDGLIKVTINNKYFSKYKEANGTLDLYGFNLSFYGEFSDEMGQVEGSEDNVIRFSGTVGSSGLSFTIPFDYKNDRANVQIEKTGNFNISTRTISYKVTVTAPADNTANAYNVVVTDKITSAGEFIEADSKKNLYRNVEVSNGSFDAKTGVWTIFYEDPDGESDDISYDMTPGQTETLTYDLVVTKEYYTSSGGTTVSNIATVTFNDNGKHQAIATQPTVGTVLVDKEYKYNSKIDKSPVMVSDEKGTYITYTLTATAYGTPMTGVVVKDTFNTPDYISSIVTEGSYKGTVTTDDTTATTKSLIWVVGDLAEEETQTLTYRAYLNVSAWQQGAGQNYLEQLVANKLVQNTAEVSVNNPINQDGTLGTGGDPIITDSTTSNVTIQKLWLDKGSEKKGDKFLFTVRVNGAPTTDVVNSIWDTIVGGKYEEGGYITLKQYDSDVSNKKLIGSYQIKISDVLNAGSTTSWTINLANTPTTDGTKDLSGRYYYVLTYYVTEATGATFTNSAGLGIAGGGFSVTKEVQGLSGWTKDTDFTKSTGNPNYMTGEIPCTIYLTKTVTPGFIVFDHVSTGYCYENGWTWFDDDALSKVVVKQGNTVLTENVDYIITGDIEDIQRANETTKDYYSGFKVTFLREVEASSSSKITISYGMKFDNKMYNGDKTGSMTVTNYLNVYYIVNGELKTALENGDAGAAQFCWTYYPFNVPLTKSNGTYDAASGTVYWDLKVNNRGTVDGNATLIDLLPEGLTFESAVITKRGIFAGGNDKFTTYRNGVVTTMNGKGQDEVVTADDCKVEEYTAEDGTKYSKVSLSIENLSGFDAVSGGKLVKDGYSPVVGAGHDGLDYAYGTITVRVTAKVDATYLASLSQATTITNKAILTDNECLPEGGVTATGDATLPATGSSVVSKAMATQESPAYVQFALDINENALDLLPGIDTVAVNDVMGQGMSMATSKEDCFKVYDVTGITDLYKSDGSVDAKKAAAGSDITGQCTWEYVADESNTYRFTVPDGKHVVIVYWASFQGVAGQKVDLSNTASFYYEGRNYSNNSSKWSAKLSVSGADGDAYTNPFFYLQKLDQWGSNVSGAVFTLSEYDQATGTKKEITKVTTQDGKAYVGQRSGDSFAKLQLNTIYVLEEYSVPAGYVMDQTDHYFEFVSITGTGTDGEVTDDDVKKHNASHPTLPNGASLVDINPGGTYTVTNTFQGPSLTIPVAKKINGKDIESTSKFSFTLTQTKNDTDPYAYTDEDYKYALKSGIQTTITGSGSSDFKLYFKSVGTYTFEITEDDLSQDAVDRGYSKDTTRYTVTVVVGASSDGKKLEITSATYSGGGKSGDIKNGDKPTFDNTLSLTGKLDLQVKKVVTSRAAAVKEGEFSFQVLKDGVVRKDENGKDVFTTKAGGQVDITIVIDQDDIGDQDFVIKEVVPADDDKDPSIDYTASPVIASVTIGEVKAADNGGKAGVAATSEVTYTAQKFEESGDDKVPLMINKYTASGQLTLTATKKLVSSTDSSLESTVHAGQFNFVVREGNSRVATGTTEEGGQITFTPINYVAADIGTHVYTISEVAGDVSYIEYDAEDVTVTVEVSDQGEGDLAATVTKVGENAVAAGSYDITFVNHYSMTAPTGINIDKFQYAVILMLAGCAAILFVYSRRRARR